MLEGKLKEGFDNIKVFLEEKGIQVEIDKVLQYGVNINLGKDGNFSLYHGKRGYTVNNIKNGISQELMKELEDFIKNDFIIKEDRGIKLTKEELKIIQKKEFLKKVYNIIKKYKDYGIDLKQLIDTVEILCTEDEKIYMSQNNYSFESIENIAKRYM